MSPVLPRAISGNGQLGRDEQIGALCLGIAHGLFQPGLTVLGGAARLHLKCGDFHVRPLVVVQLDQKFSVSFRDRIQNAGFNK
ncbi:MULTISPECIES: hypothetical protein [unclassified Ruegeria]|uniref:hypothetical protein n=1 Tax=unclassified Ruegeria TaxID=2625375 RepID=UPI00148907EF|nr:MULTISPECIES: hypothetical protein [unclassified Ruegeria]